MLEFLQALLLYAIIPIYIIWGFTFAFHALLIMHHSKSAIRWARKWYSEETFITELYLFFPIIYVAYFLFELLPGLLGMSDEILKININDLTRIVYHSHLSQ